MPVWAAVVIGLGSGIATGLVGTLLTISHQRGAEFRTRMLDTAEDFLRAVEDVRSHVRVGPNGDAVTRLRAIIVARQALVPIVNRIELLYGEDSPSFLFARAVGGELLSVEHELEAVIEGRSATLDAVNADIAGVSMRISDFSRAARLEVRRGALRRAVQRWLAGLMQATPPKSAGEE